MSKKLIILFTTTFIIASVFFSSYFVVRETRGVAVGGALDMNNHKITNLNTNLSLLTDYDLLPLYYLHNLPSLTLDGRTITSWCAVQWFSWCSGGYPEQSYCGDGTCDGGEECGLPEECELDCGPCDGGFD